MVHRKKILVLESETLLACSIFNLLASRAEFDVTETTATCLACLEQSDSPQPDVVILEEELLAANISAVVRLADRLPELRLIVFGLRESKVQVFDKQIVEVKQVSDLLALL